VLVPNERGLDRALETTPDKVAVFLAASETFSRRNTNGSIDEVLDRTRPVIGRSRSAGLPVRAYVSCVVACPYDGPIEPVAVRSVVERLLEAGADEIDLGETIGVAGPVDLERLLAGLGGCLAPADATLHLHDTRGTALAVALRAMQLGVRSFDASCGGLGGCPYAPGATGNLATEDLVYLADRCGIETGVSLEGLVEASSIMARALGRRPPSRVWRATVAAAGATTETSENH